MKQVHCLSHWQEKWLSVFAKVYGVDVAVAALIEFEKTSKLGQSMIKAKEVTCNS